MEEKQNSDEIKRMSSYNSFSYTELAEVYVNVSAMYIWWNWLKIEISEKTQ